MRAVALQIAVRDHTTVQILLIVMRQVLQGLRTGDRGLGTETNYPGAALLGRKLSCAWYLQWENIKLIQDRRYRMQDTTKYKYPPSDASVSVSLGRVGDTFCEESRVADQEFPF